MQVAKFKWFDFTDGNTSCYALACGQWLRRSGRWRLRLVISVFTSRYALACGESVSQVRSLALTASDACLY